MKSIRLRPGKERSLLRRHPWVFDGAIAKGGGDAGETVRVESHEGQFLGWAAFSPSSKIRARVWSFDENERIDASFFIARIVRAIRARDRFAIPSDGVRLVHGESDGLPGVVVDRYADTLVAQFSSCGAERWKGVIVEALLAQTGLTRLYERSDASVRSLEGLPEATGWLNKAPTLATSRAYGGTLPLEPGIGALRLRPGEAGSAAPAGEEGASTHPQGGSADTEVIIREHDWKLSLDVAEGHKTGFYLDQRDSRRKFAEHTRRLQFQDVLNCYCYTGGFTVAALAGGAAHVTSIDSSGPAIERAKANVALNGFDAARTTMLDADVNASLRQFHKEGRTFDAIVLDPPKFAPTVAHAERAARAYKDINRIALSILAPGGVLFTYSCSGGISADLFHKIVASAGIDAGVDAFITERLGGAPDHPMTVNFPEGEYLKGLVLLRK
ncbi:MAG: class I SAM-dependent methyltransferase [Polaromonas sp.]|uniref:class I SAM-dependent rRNA methyltransferase n=1 Tax=Polaromonas sp. TaxID=1869339 RepID=UPI002730C854|nr:class I SAM-dependent methyltransferase [Polaromonas sp.]MDP2257102.1 class I SAM-dependent methyltransferase [Polaromonas sp.]